MNVRFWPIPNDNAFDDMRRLIAGVIGVFVTCAAVPSNLVMPQELVDFAENNGCTQLEDFFNRAGSVDGPFAYTNDKSSAVLWCKKKTPDSKPYLLLLKDAPQFARGCPSKLEWWNPPGGLTLRKITAALRDFRYLDDKDRRGPSPGQTSSIAIVSSYDGVEAIFYCHESKWLYMMRH